MRKMRIVKLLPKNLRVFASFVSVDKIDFREIRCQTVS